MANSERKSAYYASLEKPYIYYSLNMIQILAFVSTGCFHNPWIFNWFFFIILPSVDMIVGTDEQNPTLE